MVNLPDAAPTGATSVKLRLILLRRGGLHHGQGVPAGPQRAGGVGGRYFVSFLILSNASAVALRMNSFLSLSSGVRDGIAVFASGPIFPRVHTA